MSKKAPIVDENDNVIGTGTKGEILEKGLIHRTIKVLVFNNEGKVLLQKRSKKLAWPEKWDQSVGGWVDAGEDYRETAVRESEEELGIKEVELFEVCKFYSQIKYNGFTKNSFNKIYKCTYEGDFMLDENEILSVEWFSLDDVYNLIDSKSEILTPGCVKTFLEYRRHT